MTSATENGKVVRSREEVLPQDRIPDDDSSSYMRGSRYMEIQTGERCGKIIYRASAGNPYR